MSLHPFAESTASVALRNLDALLAKLRSAATWRRVDPPTFRLLQSAIEDAAAARHAVASAMVFQEMAVTTGNEEG